MTSCRARTGREEDGLRVCGNRSSLAYVVRRAKVSDTWCEGEKKNRGSKARRKRLQKKRLRRGERGNGGRWRLTHSSFTHRRSRAPVSSSSAIPVCSVSLRPTYHSVESYMSSMVIHGCPVQDCEQTTAAVLMTNSCSSHPTQ